MTLSASKPKITLSLIFVVVIIGLIPIPLVDLASYSGDTMLSIDGIAMSVYIVLALGICTSLMLFVALCILFKNLTVTGVLFSILTAQIIILPISQVIGPVLGVILGGVAGLVSFTLLKKTNLLAV